MQTNRVVPPEEGEGSSVEGDGAIVAAMYRALADREYEAAADRVAEDIVVSAVALDDTYHGRSGFLEYVRGWGAAFPDCRFERLEVAGTADHVVVEYLLQGTHTGPLVTPGGHIPPTGMEVQAHFCDVVGVSPGGIIRIKSYFDTATILRQLGLISGTPLHSPERRASLDLYAQSVDSNAPQRNKAIVHRFLQDVYNRQKPAAAADTCAQNIVWHGGPLGEAQGLADFQKVLSTFFTAFPDLELQVADTVAEGDRVVIRFTIAGTHKGFFRGVAPTQKRVVATGTNTYRVAEDRIVEEWWQGDLWMLLRQMDAAPSNLRLSTT